MPIAVLFLAVVACGPLPDSPNNTQPDAGSVPRRAGECSDQRFKDAELAAYRAFVQAQTDAANRRTSQITNIEAGRKKLLSKLSDDYQTDLKACGDGGDAGCTLTAKTKYDNAAAAGQRLYDQTIRLVQDEERAAIEAAQAAYNAAVEQARQKYCTKAYTAAGEGSGVEISGVICSLELPFNLGASTSFVSYNVEFIPSSATTGTFSYHWSQGPVINATASGTYTVAGIETDSPRISVTGGASGVIQPGTADAGLEAVVIVLTPLTTDECKQP